jgi:hypothetical protein
MTTAQQSGPAIYKSTTRDQWDSPAAAWDVTPLRATERSVPSSVAVRFVRWRVTVTV